MTTYPRVHPILLLRQDLGLFYVLPSRCAQRARLFVALVSLFHARVSVSPVFPFFPRHTDSTYSVTSGPRSDARPLQFLRIG